MASTKDAEYALYYWPGIKGRGEYIRLMFEDAGVPYYDVGRHEGKAAYHFGFVVACVFVHQVLNRVSQAGV